MTTTIRHCFETNSSSSHSLVITPDAPLPSVQSHDFGFLSKDDKKTILVIQGQTEFGWQWDIWDKPGDKANYLYIDASYEQRYRLRNLIKTKFNVDEVVFLLGSQDSWVLDLACPAAIEEARLDASKAYIDHDSAGTSRDDRIWANDETLWAFLVSDQNLIRGGNDNEEGPW